MSAAKPIIIIQARMGSTRMPGKVLKPFFDGKSILKIIIEKLSSLDFPLILATSTNKGDDAIFEFGKKHSIHVFRGDENDVLKRMIDAGDLDESKTVIRVCADNPFLSIDLIRRMWNLSQGIDFDYLSFSYSETPTILTHFGVFAEMVKLDALKKVKTMTSEKLYLEHVTNFVYKNPSDFRVVFIPLKEDIFISSDIRLTIDTLEDFEIGQEIYSLSTKLYNSVEVGYLNKTLEQHPEFLAKMKVQKIKNSK